MIVVVADTSGLLAAADVTDPSHLQASRALDQAGTVVLSPVLLAELDHVGRRALGHDATHRLIDELARQAAVGRVLLPSVTADVLADAQAGLVPDDL